MTPREEARVLELIRYCSTTLRAWLVLNPEKGSEEVAEDLNRKWGELCQR